MKTAGRQRKSSRCTFSCSMGCGCSAGTASFSILDDLFPDEDYVYYPLHFEGDSTEGCPLPSGQRCWHPQVGGHKCRLGVPAFRPYLDHLQGALIGVAAPASAGEALALAPPVAVRFVRLLWVDAGGVRRCRRDVDHHAPHKPSCQCTCRCRRRSQPHASFQVALPSSCFCCCAAPYHRPLCAQGTFQAALQQLVGPPSSSWQGHPP